MAYSDLSQDSNGWTIFIPVATGRIVFVSNDGNDGTATVYDGDHFADPFNPGTVNAFLTYSTALSHMRDGYADWLLFSRGDTFSVQITDRSGASDTQLALVGAYGASGDMPIIHPPAAGTTNLLLDNNFQRMAVTSLDFYHTTRDPDSGEYTGTDGGYGIRIYVGTGETGRQVIIEGCKFRFYTGNLIQNNGGTVEDIVFRRNVVLDNYVQSGDSHGLFSSFIDGFLFEENIFDHNGWYSKSGIGQPATRNHGTYFSTMDDVIFRKNIVTRSSSGGSKWESNAGGCDNALVEDNLWIDGESGLFMGINEEVADYLFTNCQVKDNIVTNVDRDPPTARDIGWGMMFSQFSSLTLSGNILMNWENSAITNTFGFRFQTRLKDSTIENNIVYNMNPHGNSDDSPAFYLYNNLTDCSNNDVIGNYFQEPLQDLRIVQVVEEDDLAAFTFTGNKYYADSEVFTVEGSGKTFAQWVALTGDTSTFSQYTFIDSTRDIETYMSHLGETATIDAFVAKCRAQSRFSWDTDYTAEVVNAWIRIGFFALSGPTTSRMHFILT